MENDILSVIEREIPGFSKGQRLIAKYILDNYDKAAFMTAGKLGKTVGVSESTVVRFASELGYDGYPEMRRVLQDVVRNKLTSVQRIEVANEQINETNLVSSVMTADAERIQNTMEQINRDDFNHAVNSIINGKHVYIIGTRSSASLALFFGYYMRLIREDVHVTQDTAASEIIEQLFRVGAGDVVVAFSFPRYSSRTTSSPRSAATAAHNIPAAPPPITTTSVFISQKHCIFTPDILQMAECLGYIFSRTITDLRKQRIE